MGKQPDADVYEGRLKAADLDGDAHIDLLFTQRPNDGKPFDLRVIWGGTQEAETVVQGTVSESPWSFEVADLDGDGDGDIILTTALGLNIAEQLTERRFEVHPVQALRGPDSRPYYARIADVDGDGAQDIVFASSMRLPSLPELRNLAPLGSLRGDGALGLEHAPTPRTDWPDDVVHSLYSALYLTHIDDDEHLDAAAVTQAPLDGATEHWDWGRWLLTSYLGRGDGTFDPPVEARLGLAGRAGPSTLTDLDGDGRPELILAESTSSTTVFQQASLAADGTFATPQPLREVDGFVGKARAVADFNGDDRPDIVAIDNHALTLLMGDDDQAFDHVTRWSPPLGVIIDADVVDYDGDGADDLLLAVAVSECNATACEHDADCTGGCCGDLGYCNPGASSSRCLGPDADADAGLDEDAGVERR